MSGRSVRAGAVLASCLCVAHGVTGEEAAYAGSSFRAVSQAVFEEPYARLPHHPVELQAFDAVGADPGNRLRHAARRTLTQAADLLDFPGGRKLLQANGICFSGAWRATAQTPWTGLFAAGTDVPAIARASVALGATTRGSRRAFGLAVKLFPAASPDEVVPTANFFVMDSLAGSFAPRFLDATLDNEPALGGLPGGLAAIRLGLRIRDDMTAADAEASPGGPDYAYRPVAQIARAGMAPGAPVRAPRWLRLRADPALPRNDAEDFRDELRLERFPERRLILTVDAADAVPGTGKRGAAWRRVGKLEFTRDVVSPGCDGRLHFAHPRIE
ncbi:MAG: hypothetical protein AB7Q97_26600 [Gammaproteobacteria bacterium]